MKQSTRQGNFVAEATELSMSIKKRKQILLAFLEEVAGDHIYGLLFSSTVCFANGS